MAARSSRRVIAIAWGNLGARPKPPNAGSNVAAIQAEGAVNEILSTPEINSLLQTAERLGKTAESAPQLIDAQRSALSGLCDVVVVWCHKARPNADARPG